MTLLKNQTLPFCAMLLLAVSLSLHGQDGAETRDDDGDGLSNLVEAVLGTDPAFAEKLTLVGQDPTLAEGDHKSSARKKVPDM
ncbi:MAG: hypothetical protein KAI66_18600, partial [Lentisphaeria bacterium]|nr:hypothetical protein [Lentisphaeria bacterium]